MILTEITLIVVELIQKKFYIIGHRESILPQHFWHQSRAVLIGHISTLLIATAFGKKAKIWHSVQKM
jgi:hypothetical protein